MALPERLPPNSCDTHLHVFGDPKIYPAANPHALYHPPQDCTFQALQDIHAGMGIERAVLVQATIYGTDHRLLHDVLKAAPKGRYRGVAIVDETVSNAELQRLHDVGVRAARFNFGGNFKLAPSLTTFRRSLERIRELGWCAKIFGFGDDFLVVEDELRRIETPAIIDHMGGLDYRRGPDQPVVRLILDLLAKDNWWIGLSNGDLRSHTGHPWSDAVEFGRLFFGAVPERCIWGTDWPHVHRFIRPDKDGHSDYGVAHELERVALLERYMPDRAARDRVLVDNPARLFGFG
jgi:predicted TIM-barrel fold metal-dependent hydrolase